MRHYDACTCVVSSDARPLKYRRVKATDSGQCVDCGHFTLSIPANVPESEIASFLGLSKNSAKFDESNPVNFPYKTPRYLYGWE